MAIRNSASLCIGHRSNFLVWHRVVILGGSEGNSGLRKLGTLNKELLAVRHRLNGSRVLVQKVDLLK